MKVILEKKNKMKKTFFAIASLSVLIVAFSFAYYLVIFIPNKEKVLGEQKVELTPYLTPFPTPTLILTDTPTPKLTFTNTQIPQLTNVIIPTTQPTARPDDSSKIAAIKNLFQKIAILSAEIINTSVAIEANKGSSSCSREELMKNPNLTPMAIESLMSRCLDLHRSLLNKITATKNEIGNINLQIQGIISTCGTDECNQLYQEVVTGLEAKGYIVR